MNPICVIVVIGASRWRPGSESYTRRKLLFLRNISHRWLVTYPQIYSRIKQATKLRLGGSRGAGSSDELPAHFLDPT
jgi:hypothetical protein